MANQIIAILCEGPHDVAFITKIIKSAGYISNERVKIKDFPSPMNELLKSEVVKSNVEDLNIQEVRQVLLPSNVLMNDSNYLFFYSMGGDSKSELRKKLLGDFLALIPQKGEIPILDVSTKL